MSTPLQFDLDFLASKGFLRNPSPAKDENQYFQWVNDDIGFVKKEGQTSIVILPVQGFQGKLGKWFNQDLVTWERTNKSTSYGVIVNAKFKKPDTTNVIESTSGAVGKWKYVTSSELNLSDLAYAIQDDIDCELKILYLYTRKGDSPTLCWALPAPVTLKGTFTHSAIYQRGLIQRMVRSGKLLPYPVMMRFSSNGTVMSLKDHYLFPWKWMKYLTINRKYENAAKACLTHLRLYPNADIATFFQALTGQNISDLPDVYEPSRAKWPMFVMERSFNGHAYVKSGLNHQCMNSADQDWVLENIEKLLPLLEGVHPEDFDKPSTIGVIRKSLLKMVPLLNFEHIGQIQNENTVFGKLIWLVKYAIKFCVNMFKTATLMVTSSVVAITDLILACFDSDVSWKSEFGKILITAGSSLSDYFTSGMLVKEVTGFSKRLTQQGYSLANDIFENRPRFIWKMTGLTLAGILLPYIPLVVGSVALLYVSLAFDYNIYWWLSWPARKVYNVTSLHDILNWDED